MLPVTVARFSSNDSERVQYAMYMYFRSLGAGLGEGGGAPRGPSHRH